MGDLEAIITGAVNDNRADLEDAGDVIDSGTTEEAIIPEVSTDGTEEAVIPEVESVVGGEEKPPVVEEDAFAKEYGISPKDKSGTRDNRIPYSNVKKIVGNAEGKLAEAVLGRPLAAGEKALDVVKAHVARIPTLEAENTAYKTKMTSVDHVEHIMENQPARFLDMLVAINPAYKALIGGGTGTHETKEVDPNAGMPQPDHDLGVDAEGKPRGKTYSQQGFIDVMKWQADQTRAAVLAEVNTTFKPVKDQMDSDARVQALIPQLDAAVNAARANWKGFKENEPAILAAITAANAARKPLSLGDAYVSVINDVHEKLLAKLTTDEAAMRKKLLAEMKRAPSSTSIVPAVGTSRVADTGEGGGLEAVIKKAWDDSKR